MRLLVRGMGWLVGGMGWLVRGMGWLVRCIPGGEGDFVGTVSITTNATGGRARLPTHLPLTTDDQ